MNKIGRNDPCRCGSGKKYKKCCLRRDKDEPIAASLAQVQAEMDELDTLSNSVLEMLRAGRFREAEDVCQRLLGEYPDQVDGLERLAMTCAAQGRKKEAAEWYRKTVEFMRSHDGFDEEAVAWPLDEAKRLEAEFGEQLNADTQRRTPKVEQLNDILENLIELSADRVTLEWTSDGIEVSMYNGPMGVGGILADPLAGAIMNEVVSRAKLERRSKGSLEAKIRNEQMKFLVKEYDHVGESAFEIRMRS
jgi:tetratricopeptide (TPR) repeat protein